ncbi:hypothetical protein HD554DRAFT_1817867 [Boletus coccyginus]|nr:hypothetical protein HD554DRAFT_1817867 [Boletus coccyginus]
MKQGVRMGIYNALALGVWCMHLHVASQLTTTGVQGKLRQRTGRPMKGSSDCMIIGVGNSVSALLHTIDCWVDSGLVPLVRRRPYTCQGDNAAVRSEVQVIKAVYLPCFESTIPRVAAERAI